MLETVVRAQYAPPGYLLFIRGNALMAQSFDPGAMRLSGDVMSIAEDVWNDTGGGDADFAVAEGVLAYRERERNLGELVWLDRAGQPLGNAGERADYIHPWLSPDGRRAVVEIVDPDTQAHSVWMLDLVRGSRSQFVPGPAQSHFPVWSPDGRTILFSSDRGGPWSLFAKPVYGRGRRRGASRGRRRPASPSTGRATAGSFSTRRTTPPRDRTSGLCRWPREGNRLPSPTARGNERQAQLSPDGRWVAYASDDSGREDIWVQGFPDATEKWPVSTAGGSQPQWRRDGRELFYISRDFKLMAVDVNAAASSFDAGVPRALFSLRFGRASSPLGTTSCRRQTASAF